MTLIIKSVFVNLYQYSNVWYCDRDNTCYILQNFVYKVKNMFADINVIIAQVKYVLSFLFSHVHVENSDNQRKSRYCNIVNLLHC